MLSCGELSTFLRVASRRVKRELVKATKEYMADVEKDAKALIGQELPNWKALAESTVKEKERLGYVLEVSATDPLLRTGKLRASIKSEAHRTNEGAEGAVGSKSKIALYQEVGTTRIPPRPFLSTALQHAHPKAHKHFGELAVHVLTTPGIR